MNTVQSPRNPVTHWVVRSENPVTNNGGAYHCRRGDFEGEMISALKAAVSLANFLRNISTFKWLIHNLVAWSTTNDIVGRWPWWRLINLIIIALSILYCLPLVVSLEWLRLFRFKQNAREKFLFLSIILNKSPPWKFNDFTYSPYCWTIST